MPWSTTASLGVTGAQPILTGIGFLNVTEGILVPIGSIAGTTGGFPNYPVNSASYEGEVALSASSTATGACWAAITLNWQNLAGITIAFETYWVYCGIGTSPHLINFRGKAKGNLVTPTIFFNTPGLGNGSINSFNMYGSNRTYNSDLWYSQSFLSVAGGGAQVVAPNDPTGKYLANVAVTAAAQNVATTFYCGLYTGHVSVTLSSTTVTGVKGTLQSTLDANAGTSGLDFTNQGGLAGTYAPVLLPNVQENLTITNINAAAQNINARVIGTDF